ncbi:hypothetical protein C8J57DRAFT_82763 [Mycena rebaudengoi]|nr:hypothetical protein C8J57DRAFT_82763 [Mycena rebaudengoi]
MPLQARTNNCKSLARLSPDCKAIARALFQPFFRRATPFSAAAFMGHKLQWWVRARELAAQEARTSQLRRADETLRSASMRRRRWRLYNPCGPARAPADLGPLARGTITRAAGVLEILVDDNETLKRNNVELQQLLADAREDCRALQEEVEDQCMNPGSVSRAGTPSFSRHYHTGSVPAAMLSPTYGFKRSRASKQYNLLHPRRTAARFRRGLAL